jgi:hypothetical protein
MSSPSVDECLLEWTSARDAIRARTSSAPEETARRLTALWRWRLRAARARSEVLASAFVATCAARLAALDASSDHSAARALARPAARLEASSFVEFDPPGSAAEALAAVRAAAWRWNDEEFADWNAVAYAVAIAGEAETVELDEPFLLECARFDADCALRAELRERLWAAAAPPDPRRPAALAWARRKTANANDDLFALGREALVWTHLTPRAARRGEGPPSRRLAAWDAGRGAQAHAACAPGFAALGGPDEHATSALFVYLFDYVLRQTVGVRFIDLFFIADLVPDEASRRLDEFHACELRNPPPLVVHSLREWHVVRQGAGDGGTTAHGSAVDAVLAWLDEVERTRRGVLFLGKNTSHLLREMTAEEVRPGGALVASTEAV